MLNGTSAQYTVRTVMMVMGEFDIIGANDLHILRVLNVTTASPDLLLQLTQNGLTF